MFERTATILLFFGCHQRPTLLRASLFVLCTSIYHSTHQVVDICHLSDHLCVHRRFNHHSFRVHFVRHRLRCVHLAEYVFHGWLILFLRQYKGIERQLQVAYRTIETVTMQRDSNANLFERIHFLVTPLT